MSWLFRLVGHWEVIKFSNALDIVDFFTYRNHITPVLEYGYNSGQCPTPGNSMNNKNIIVIGGVVAVVLAAFVAYQTFTRSTPDNTEVVTPTATSSEIVPQGEGVSAEVIDTVAPTQENPKPTGGPSIATSIYTVYIGFAASFGTSSEAVMRQEVSKAVIGYELEALPESPTFDSATLPRWDPSEAGLEKKYEVYLWDENTNTYQLFGSYPALEEIQFPREGFKGQTRFKVLGIPPALRVCPGDRSFNWAARFTLPLQLGLVRTPITQELLPWETCRMR